MNSNVYGNIFTERIPSLTYQYYINKINEIIENTSKKYISVVDTNHEYAYYTNGTFKLWSEIELGEFICDITLNTLQSSSSFYLTHNTNSTIVFIAFHIKYKFPKENPPLTIKNMMSKLFVPDKIGNDGDSTIWFIVSLCGGAIPVEVSILNNNELISETFTIPSYDCDKKSAEWKEYISTLKRLNIKRVKRYRF